MKRVFFIAFIFLMNYAQAKTFLIGLQTNHVSAKDKLYAAVKGGDTLMMQPGSRGAIQFADFEGEPKNYVTIINAEGLIEIKENTLPYGISLRNCHYLRLSGGGSGKVQYGIQIEEVSREGAGLGISDRCDNIEICNLEICNTKGPGILCKTNPDCITYRETYTASNFNIHNNYVHHTGTEGMYIGSTAFEGVKMKCGDDTLVHLAPLLKNVEVFDNLVEYTGWDGIQISLANNVKCYSNKISFDSQKDEPWQNCGLIIGGGTNGKFHNNIIFHGKGYPINCFGTGNVEITANAVFEDSSSTKTAVYINDKLADKHTHYVVNFNYIETKHLPAITIINKKQRKADLIMGNEISTERQPDAISYEGVKPMIK